MRTRVRVYLDGLNFYYGITRPYDFKWVDIEGLFESLLTTKIPNPTIEKILLYSAEVNGDGPRQRQANYFMALTKHSPCIDVQMGKFQISKKRGRNRADNRLITIEIREEKQTDVNLACKMVDDAHTSAGTSFDVACLISNDGDITAALRVKQRLNQRTILILPRAIRGQCSSQIASPSKSLKELIPRDDRIYNVSRNDLENHPLPPVVDGLTPPKARGWKL